jgi:transcriptional regulator with XRE-family HTH domain
MSTLFREAMGDALKEQRDRKHRTMRQVVIQAGKGSLSIGYLSEIERGKKEVSSELLDALLKGLDYELSQLLRDTADKLEGAR